MTPLSPSTGFKAYGIPSFNDSICTYPLTPLSGKHATANENGVPYMAYEILTSGKTLLGTTATYAQAVALCKAWKLGKPERRTVISIPKPQLSADLQ